MSKIFIEKSPTQIFAEIITEPHEERNYNKLHDLIDHIDEEYNTAKCRFKGNIYICKENIVELYIYLSDIPENDDKFFSIVKHVIESNKQLIFNPNIKFVIKNYNNHWKINKIVSIMSHDDINNNIDIIADEIGDIINDKDCLCRIKHNVLQFIKDKNINNKYINSLIMEWHKYYTNMYNLSVEYYNYANSLQQNSDED